MMVREVMNDVLAKVEDYEKVSWLRSMMIDMVVPEVVMRTDT